MSLDKYFLRKFEDGILFFFCMFGEFHFLYNLTFGYFMLDYQRFFFEKVTEAISKVFKNGRKFLLRSANGAFSACPP